MTWGKRQGEKSSLTHTQTQNDTDQMNLTILMQLRETYTIKM